MPTLEFEGKSFVYAHHLSVPYRELIPVPDKGVGQPDLSGNLIIHGDNLEALKALLPRYAGKVDVIYIDPPYNTGNEGWAYNDNVNSPVMKEWLGKVVGADDLQRHDKWLCMMWPRLELLKELLAPHGTIWINLDDNEIGNARLALDEIFGEGNFVANVIWQKIFSPKNTAQYFSEDHDYILVYALNKDTVDIGSLPRTAAMEARYSNRDENPRGPWTSGDLSARNFYGEGTYPIKTPSGRIISGPPKGMYWRVSKRRFDQLDAEDRVWWGADGDNVPRLKRFLSDVKDGRVAQTLWLHNEVGNTQEAKKELLSIMDFGEEDDVFITPKPSRLIERVVALSGNDNALVLDSFAGSGTTAHAVLAANQRDGGKRKFILVETEDYADTLTAERVRRVIKGVPGAKDEALRAGLGGTFTYCELGEPMDAERFFGGTAAAPTWEQVARYVIFTATGETADIEAGATAPHPGAARRPSPGGGRGEEGKDWFAAEAGGQRIHVIYRPDRAFMRSAESALTLDLARAISTEARKLGKPALVFGGALFVSTRELRKLGITFAQLPWSVHERLNAEAGA